MSKFGNIEISARLGNFISQLGVKSIEQLKKIPVGEFDNEKYYRGPYNLGRETKKELTQLINRSINESDTIISSESFDRRSPKILKYIEELNSLIKQTVDNEGEPIGVIDPSSTWETPMVYKPIIYNKNGTLKIVNTYPMEPRRGEDVEIIKKQDMEYEGIPTLQNIRKMYVKAFKNKSKIQYNESKQNNKLKITESELKSLIIEKIIKVLNENDGLEEPIDDDPYKELKQRAEALIAEKLEDELREEEVDEDSSQKEVDDAVEDSNDYIYGYEGTIDFNTSYVKPELDYFNGTGTYGGYTVSNAIAYLSITIYDEDGEYVLEYDADVKLDV